MSLALSVSVNLVNICCGECDIVFAVPEYWKIDRERDHRVWYCPNGHERYYPGESDIEKLKKQLSQAEVRLQTATNDAQYHRNRAEHAERSRDAQKGIATRIKNRVKRGLCPCCSRHFPDVATHLAEKHPSYGGEEK